MNYKLEDFEIMAPACIAAARDSLETTGAIISKSSNL